jgi:hypothetical protein
MSTEKLTYGTGSDDDHFARTLTDFVPCPATIVPPFTFQE